MSGKALPKKGWACQSELERWSGEGHSGEGHFETKNTRNGTAGMQDARGGRRRKRCDPMGRTTKLQRPLCYGNGLERTLLSKKELGAFYELASHSPEFNATMQEIAAYSNPCL